jgi:hypothetical protein
MILFPSLLYGCLRVALDDDLDATVVGATLGAGVISDWGSLAKPMGLDSICLVTSFHDIVANFVRPALR